MNTILNMRFFSLILISSLCSAIYAQEPPVKVEHKGMVYVLENGKWVVTQGEGRANSVAVLNNGKWVLYKGIRVARDHSIEVQKLGKWSRAVGQAIAVDDISYKFERGQWIVRDGIRVKGSEVQVYDSGAWVTKSKKEQPVVVDKEKPTPTPEPTPPVPEPTPPPQLATEKKNLAVTKTSKDDCLKSGFHWVDKYPGKDKCFTAEEFDIYTTYGDNYLCTQSGYYRFLHKTGLFSGFSFCANLSKGLDYCNEESQHHGTYSYRTFTEPDCRKICTALKKTYNETNGRCEEKVTLANPADATQKNDCLKSGHHWIERYRGKNKCFTEQERKLFDEGWNPEACMKKGYFHFVDSSVWIPHDYGCMTFSKAVEYCKETENQPYVWHSQFSLPARCGSLGQAEQYCKSFEQGKKYNPTNGHCE